MFSVSYYRCGLWEPSKAADVIPTREAVEPSRYERLEVWMLAVRLLRKILQGRNGFRVLVSAGVAKSGSFPFFGPAIGAPKLTI
jgi:hypothetical protein